MSQLTGCSQQNLTDMKCNQQSIIQSHITNSISESALNTLTPQHCSTSSESSISNVCVQFAVKNDGRNSLKKRRNKLRKKSYASVSFLIRDSKKIVLIFHLLHCFYFQDNEKK